MKMNDKDTEKKKDLPKASPAEVEKCKAVEKEKQEIKDSRSQFEKQWLINIAFLYGRHYFSVDRKSPNNLDEKILWEFKRMDRKKKTKRISNYILPLFRSLLSKLLLMKSTTSVEATTNAERDRSAAKVGQELLEEFWQSCNKRNPKLCQDSVGMLMVLKKLFSYMLAIGGGYLFPYFNPKARANAYLEEKVVRDVEIGEVECKVLHHFNVYRQTAGRFLIIEEHLHVDEVEEQYGVEVESETLEAPDFEQRLISMLEQSSETKKKDHVRVLQKWHIPCKKHPEGQLFVCTKNRILYDDQIPEEYKGRIPLFEFRYLDFMLAPFAQGMVEQLIPLQEEYNLTISRLAAYKKWMAGKVMIPRKAKISAKWDDEVGQLIFYNSGFGTPQYQNPPAPPAFLLEELVRLRKDMEDLAGSHDTSMGRTPTGVKSGVGIENLHELDNSQMAPELMTVEQKLSFFAEMVLDIAQHRYTVPRMLAITGDMFGTEVKSFKGEDVDGNKRVKISLGSSLPSSKSARQEQILMWKKEGIITPDKARELLEFGDVEGVFHNLDEQAEKEELHVMLTQPNIQIVVEPYEEHNIRVKVLTDYMKGAEFMQLPMNIRENFKRHLGAHQEYIRQEHEAASRLGGNTGMPAQLPQSS